MKKLKGKVPDCASCKPEIMDANMPVMYLIERYSTTMFSEYGLSAEGITLAFDCEPWIKEDDKSTYANKIMIYLNTLKLKMSKDNKNG